MREEKPKLTKYLSLLTSKYLLQMILEVFKLDKTLFFLLLDYPLSDPNILNMVNNKLSAINKI